MPSSRRRVSEPGMAFNWNATVLEMTRVSRMALTTQMSNFGPWGNPLAKGTLRDQICVSPGVDIFDSKRYSGLGLGYRVRLKSLRVRAVHGLERVSKATNRLL